MPSLVYLYKVSLGGKFLFNTYKNFLSKYLLLLSFIKNKINLINLFFFIISLVLNIILLYLFSPWLFTAIILLYFFNTIKRQLFFNLNIIKDHEKINIDSLAYKYISTFIPFGLLITNFGFMISWESLKNYIICMWGWNNLQNVNNFASSSSGNIGYNFGNTNRPNTVYVGNIYNRQQNSEAFRERLRERYNTPWYNRRSNLRVDILSTPLETNPLSNINREDICDEGLRPYHASFPSVAQRRAYNMGYVEYKNKISMKFPGSNQVQVVNPEKVAHDAYRLVDVLDRPSYLYFEAVTFDMAYSMKYLGTEFGGYIVPGQNSWYSNNGTEGSLYIGGFNIAKRKELQQEIMQKLSWFEQREGINIAGRPISDFIN